MNFGYSVAVWSNTLVVGSPDMSGTTTNSAAFVYEWDGTQWNWQQRWSWLSYVPNWQR